MRTSDLYSFFFAARKFSGEGPRPNFLKFFSHINKGFHSFLGCARNTLLTGAPKVYLDHEKGTFKILKVAHSWP